MVVYESESFTKALLGTFISMRRSVVLVFLKRSERSVRVCDL